MLTIILQTVLSSLLTVYIFAWLVWISVAYDEYHKSGDGSELLLALFVGPIILITFFPSFLKTVATALYEKLRGTKDPD
mgnify:CR=1 FL=1